MAFFHVHTVLDLLKARLESLLVGGAGSAPLFERVGYFGANDLAKALQETFSSEKSVCFIVPVGARYQNTRERTDLTSVRSIRIVLLIADRSLDRIHQTALVGGPTNIGIVDMADTVIDSLVNDPFTGQADMVFEPGDGEPIMLSAPAAKGANSANLGRECWAQEVTAFGGIARVAVP
jgi:hypothetical protein